MSWWAAVIYLGILSVFIYILRQVSKCSQLKEKEKAQNKLLKDFEITNEIIKANNNRDRDELLTRLRSRDKE